MIGVDSGLEQAECPSRKKEEPLGRLLLGVVVGRHWIMVEVCQFLLLSATAMSFSFFFFGVIDRIKHVTIVILVSLPFRNHILVRLLLLFLWLREI